DKDLGLLHAVVTAADGTDPTLTSTDSTDLNVHVDAVADQPTVTITVNDGADANTTFQQGETGTVHVTANFGDFQDGSETHTVQVDLPAGFTVGSLSNLPAGVTATSSSGHVVFTVAAGTQGFTYDLSVTNTNNGSSTVTFNATATATENPKDEECNPDNNVATATAHQDVTLQDFTPIIVPDNALVEDDNLTNGNNEVDPPTATDTKSLHVDFGGDAPGTVKFDVSQPAAGFTSQGQAITYTVSADGQTLTGSTASGDVFTAHINGDGTYTFTLLKPIDHPIHSGTDDNTDTASFHFNVTATDHDGDTTGAQITAVV